MCQFGSGSQFVVDLFFSFEKYASHIKSKILLVSKVFVCLILCVAYLF